MKKIYLSPVMQVIVIETAGMIAQSMDLHDSTTKGFDESLSRGGSDWDED